MSEFDERLRKIDARAARRTFRLAKGDDDDDYGGPLKAPGEDNDGEDPVGGAVQTLAGVLPALLALADEGHSKPSDWDDDEVSEIPNTSQVGKILRARRRSDLPPGYNASDSVPEGAGARAEEMETLSLAADEAGSGVSSDHRVVSRPRPIGQGSSVRCQRCGLFFSDPLVYDRHLRAHTQEDIDNPGRLPKGSSRLEDPRKFMKVFGGVDLNEALPRRQKDPNGLWSDGTEAHTEDVAAQLDSPWIGSFKDQRTCPICRRVFDSANWRRDLAMHIGDGHMLPASNEKRLADAAALATSKPYMKFDEKSFGALRKVMEQNAEMRAAVDEARDLLHSPAKAEAIALRKSLRLAEGQR